MKHALSVLEKMHLPKTRKQWRIMVVAVVLGASIIAFFVHKPAKSERTQKREVITYSTDTPDEKKPGSSFVWGGSATDPKRITLPTVGAEGYLQNVGVDQKNAVAVPNNVHMAGWFVDTAIPGSKGLSIIDGHVSGRTTDGIFKNLVKLKKGDTFTVTFGDDSIKTFEVDEVSSIKAEDSADVLFSQKPGIVQQLNLITCGGKFDRAKQQYEDRVIVITKAR